MKRHPLPSRQGGLEITLALTEAIANIPNPQALFQVIYETLRPVLRFEATLIILPTDNPEYGEIYLQALSMPEELQALRQRPAIFIREALAGFDPNSTDILRFELADIKREEVDMGAELEIMEKALGIKHFTLCPLVHSGKIVGYWVLGNGRSGPLSDEALPLLQQVSKIIAGAVASTTAYTRLSQREQEAQRQLAFTTAIMDIHEPRDFLEKMLRSLLPLKPFLLGTATGFEEDDITSPWYFADHQGLRPILEDPLPFQPAALTPNLLVQVLYYNQEALAKWQQEIIPRYKICAAVQIVLQLETSRQVLTLCANADQAAQLLAPGLFEQIAPQLYLAFHNRAIWQEVQSLQSRLRMENRVLLDEIAPPTGHQQIIGQSAAFRKVLARASLVAQGDTTVLILGETGTGKEVLARYLHDSSLRHDKPLVRINCAALPAQLIESELFGHEKGSFTGAVERRLGKFELAQGGTLFLDEIGELPFESQAKLLRVLQEKEFERVGGHQVLHADVRVIAATNRDLAEASRQGHFRTDLYYRLSVFPLTLPPLRERPEDIPLLADTFLRRATKKLGRTLRPLARDELDLLTAYAWPGNIRELEHVMENAAILAKDTEPNLRDFRKLSTSTDIPDEEDIIAPLEEMNRQHILRALRKCRGRIGGTQGAAALLGLNEKTLGSKMRKLGIQRKVDFN
jgi:formate hydrogenlyase transcriptional activator